VIKKFIDSRKQRSEYFNKKNLIQMQMKANLFPNIFWSRKKMEKRSKFVLILTAAVVSNVDIRGSQPGSYVTQGFHEVAKGFPSAILYFAIC
jgi:hypothetical protein